MIKSEMAAKARELWNNHPVLTLTGPRQSAKTTLARSAFPELAAGGGTMTAATNEPDSLLQQ